MIMKQGTHVPCFRFHGGMITAKTDRLARLRRANLGSAFFAFPLKHIAPGEIASGPTRHRNASVPSLNSHATITMNHESAISWTVHGVVNTA